MFPDHGGQLSPPVYVLLEVSAFLYALKGEEIPPDSSSLTALLSSSLLLSHLSSSFSSYLYLQLHRSSDTTLVVAADVLAIAFPTRLKRDRRLTVDHHGNRFILRFAPPSRPGKSFVSFIKPASQDWLLYPKSLNNSSRVLSPIRLVVVFQPTLTWCTTSPSSRDALRLILTCRLLTIPDYNCPDNLSLFNAPSTALPRCRHAAMDSTPPIAPSIAARIPHELLVVTIPQGFQMPTPLMGLFIWLRAGD
ncbi:hypothetical protein CPB85DRAFT_1430660 [Mucidula mucida]|nr:hypothetical protein CPB85DRAFT_1430660 [Mucidula mucida]